MNRLDRYLGRAVFSATLLAWVTVAMLDALFVLLGQLGDIGRGDYAFADALLYVLLTLPTRAWQMFAMAVLIGVALGLGNLAEQRELEAFRLAGCSPRRLMLAVIKTGLLLLGVAMALGEGLAPHTQQLALQIRSTAIYADLGIQPDAGFWMRDGQRFIQVTRSETDGSLSGVVVYELSGEARLARIVTAARALARNGRWQLETVKVRQFHERRIDISHQPNAQWTALINPRLARLLTRDPDTLSLAQLSEYIAYLQRNGSDVGAWRLNFWQRLAAPLGVMAMLVLAAALVLGGLGRRPVGQRLLIAVLAGLTFKLLSGVIAHAGLVYGWGAALSALTPPLAVLLAAGGVVLRQQR